MVEFNLNELKVARVRRNYTQADMGKALNMPLTSYCKRESGVTKISVEEFAKIVDILDIKDVSIFFTDSVDKKQQ